MDKTELKNLIKEFIREELDEISTTGATPGYNTPNAFSGKSVKWRGGDLGANSMPHPEERKRKEVDDEDPGNLSEAYSKYKRFKESNTYKKHNSKVSFLAMEIKKMLKEVDYLVKISNKLKNEADISPDNLWKRTTRDLQEIGMYSKKISQNIQGLTR